MPNLKRIKSLVREHAPKGEFKPLFFKMGPGDYAEHDRFIGVSAPNLRKIAKTASDLTLDEILILLQSPINEERQLALYILINRYKQNEEEIYAFFLKHLKHVNNWNLVDSSAPLIIGAYLYGKDKSILLKFAKSSSLWDKRISIVATYYFIRKNSFDWTLKIAILLLNDPHDLIHKAVGWMLREVGKRDEQLLKYFLNDHASKMPRTMLRYAIERLSQEDRQAYLKKNVKP